MAFRRFFTVFLLLVVIISYIDARKYSSSSRSRSRTPSRGSGSSSSISRPHHVSETHTGNGYRDYAMKLTGAGNEPSRPKISGSTGNGGSEPGKIGWNVPDHKPSGNVVAKPSTPDLISKTSATNVQSGHQPSDGYNRQPASNPYYGQPGNAHNPSSGYGSSPPVGGAGHPYGAPPVYSPSGSPPGYSSHDAPPAYGQPHNPSYGQPYNSHPSGGYNPAVNHAPPTIVVQQAPGNSGGPSIGQIAKEAVVHASVNAAVNSAVNRLLPGGIRGDSYHGSSGGAAPAVVPPASHTEITYNNYYNGENVPSGNPAQAGASPDPATAPAQPAPATAPGQPAPAPAPGQPAPAPAPGQPAPPAGAFAGPAPAVTPTVIPAAANNETKASSAVNPSPFGLMITITSVILLSWTKTMVSSA